MAKWSKEQAREWYTNQPWLIGCNFLPSNAINQLEMFQQESYDPQTIEREVAWANNLGFNSLRIYLHDLLWKEDSRGFCNRLNYLLTICSKHSISFI